MKSFCVILCEVDTRVWGGHIDGTITVWSSDKYKVIKTVMEGKTIGSMLKLGDRVWIGTEDNIVVCDSTTLRPKATLEGHQSTINCLANVGPFEVWSGSLDQTIRCWNSENYDCIRKLEWDLSKLFSLLEVRTHGTVWAGCRDGRIIVWNANSYQVEQELSSVHLDATCSFVFDAKRSQMWSGSWDGTVCIWRRKKSNNTMQRMNSNPGGRANTKISAYQTSSQPTMWLKFEK
jgi:WD40 repeat protein